MNPMHYEDTTVFQALVDALLQPFTPVSYSSLNTPDAWIRVYHNQLQRTIATTGVLPIEDLDHISSQLYPRCALYVLAYAKTHGQIRTVQDIKEKMLIWGQLEVLTQFIESQAILESLRASLLHCGQLESQGMHTLDMILRFDILFITAKVLVWLSDNEQRRTCRSETGERAQALLDLFQSLLDCHPQGSSRAKLLDATFRLSKESGRVPSCLLLSNLDKDDGSVALGGGGYGDIWGGRIGKNRVAIKSMRNFNARRLEDAIRSFAREAVLWRQFHHPNILPFYGVHLWPREPEPLVCLVSPWMEKGNILEYLQKPECKDKLSLLLDVARGMDYLHNFKPPVIHGDLKGNNILISPSGGACIADFGLCTFTRDHGYQMTNRNSTGNTGAILHCAPELLSPGSIDSTQAAGGTVPEPYKSKESDVYAFGCLCFEIYTGRPRFCQMPIYFAMFAITKDRPVPQPTNIDHSLWELIHTCWQKRPRERPTITDIVRTLTSIVNGGGDGSVRECVFKWDQQVICQLNSPWAALVTPFGLGQDSHNSMTSVSVLLSEEDIRIVNRRDIIIALMGPSGVGKSSFINAVLGHDVAIVGRSMDSCTQDVRAYGCLHPDGSGRKVIMVDTPGFDDSERTDYEVLKDIVNWLADTYRQDIVLTGILQLHSIAEVRMRGTPRKNLDVFRRLCGEDALKNVILTTTYWDKVPLNIAEMRESQLKSVFWGQMIEHGCRINRFYPPTMETAWSLVSSFDNNARRPALTVQTEIVIQKKKLHQTSAFGALFEWWSKKLQSLRGRFMNNKHPSEKELARAEKEMRKMTRNNSTRSSSIGDIRRRR
ncbi:kinase-like domain-containing protein [Cyathus striatus]|nr:kinase-like domain-containing protein [Cyathus striatus]